MPPDRQKFQAEAILKDFVYENLQPLLQLISGNETETEAGEQCHEKENVSPAL